MNAPPAIVLGEVFSEFTECSIRNYLEQLIRMYPVGSAVYWQYGAHVNDALVRGEDVVRAGIISVDSLVARIIQARSAAKGGGVFERSACVIRFDLRGGGDVWQVSLVFADAPQAYCELIENDTKGSFEASQGQAEKFAAIMRGCTVKFRGRFSNDMDCYGDLFGFYVSHARAVSCSMAKAFRSFSGIKHQQRVVKTLCIVKDILDNAIHLRSGFFKFPAASEEAQSLFENCNLTLVSKLNAQSGLDVLECIGIPIGTSSWGRQWGKVLARFWDKSGPARSTRRR